MRYWCQQGTKKVFESRTSVRAGKLYYVLICLIHYSIK
jgi:hypothetical protein